jgi:hypothetical protein
MASLTPPPVFATNLAHTVNSSGFFYARPGCSCTTCTDWRGGPPADTVALGPSESTWEPSTSTSLGTGLGLTLGLGTGAGRAAFFEPRPLSFARGLAIPSWRTEIPTCINCNKKHTASQGYDCSGGGLLHRTNALTNYIFEPDAPSVNAQVDAITEQMQLLYDSLLAKQEGIYDEPAERHDEMALQDAQFNELDEQMLNLKRAMETLALLKPEATPH